MWNTSTPIISRCLQRTIPVWVPAAFLWLIAPWQVYLTLKWHKRQSFPRPPIPYNLYNISRLMLVFVIVLVNTIQFVYDLIDYIRPNVHHQVSIADLTSFALNVFTFVSVRSLEYILEKK